MSESRVGDIKIDEDEFLAIIKGLLRPNLRKFIASGGVTLPTGDGATIQVVMDAIDLPSWRFSDPPEDVAAGGGDIGDDLGPVDDSQDGEGAKGPGGGPSEKRGKGQVVIDIGDDEFADWLQEDLQLPNILPKGDRTVTDELEKYNTISRSGPRSMLHKARTLREATKRAIAEGTFQPPDKIGISINPRDRRYRSYNMVPEPHNNAVIFFMRDVSGSMGPKERRIVTFLCTLCEFWLSRTYDRLDKVYIIHDDIAERVNSQEFFHKHSGGGTICSTALHLMKQVVDEEYPVSQWNIYALYISDGFDFDPDGEAFVEALTVSLLPIVNQFNYGQVDYDRGRWFTALKKSGSSTFAMPGTLMTVVQSLMGGNPNLAAASIDVNNLNSALDALREFFKQGN